MTQESSELTEVRNSATRLWKLSEEQQKNLDMVKNQPLFEKVSGVLLETNDSFALYGGMAVMIESGNLEGFGKYEKGGRSIDFTKTGDLDLIVDEFGNVDDLVERLSGSLGDEAVVSMVEGDYPRVDIIVSGREVISISELRSSVGKIREIRKELDLPDIDDDWELYFKSKTLVNFGYPIVMSSSGSSIMNWGNNEGTAGQLKESQDALFTKENFEKLRDVRPDLAETVIREYGYWIGKLGMMKILNFGSYNDELSEGSRKDMRELKESGVIDNYPMAKSILAERILKMVNGDFQWARNGLCEYGLMWWFSPTLALELEGMMTVDSDNALRKWNTLNGILSERDNRINSGQDIVTFQDFVLDLMKGLEMNADDKDKVWNELEANFKPREKYGANWHGIRIREAI